MWSLRALVVSLVAVAIGLASPAAASAALTATGVRIGDRPAAVRVVVDFSGGRLELGEVIATDPGPGDGRARLRLTKRGVLTRAAARRAHGVSVRVVQGRGRISVRIAAARGRFKYMAVSALRGPERLVIDLYRSRPPSPEAEIRSAPDGCLGLASVRREGRRFVVRGREQDLFEHALVLRVRDAQGRLVGSRPLTAAAGRWRGSVRYRVGAGQAGTLEAVAHSAKDGSLDCIVQVRVRLGTGPA
jgi:Immunoglobulin-like domain of bacterial spore germination